MSSISRRAMLKHGVAAGAGAVLAGSPFVREGQAAATRPASPANTPRPCPPGAWRKHGEILAPTEPWEGHRIQSFTCPVEPLEADRWRLWYSATGSHREYAIAWAEGTIGGEWRKVKARCTPGEPSDGEFEIGRLPEGWRPVQPVHVRLPDGRHRLYFWVHGPEVTRYLAADSDDGRRYRVIDPLRPVLYHPNDRAAAGVATPDGFIFRTKTAARPADEPAAPSRLLSNDATMLYQLPDGSFEMFSVALVRVDKDHPGYVAHDNAAGYLRVIDRYTSGDGLRFENRQRVIQCDAADPADMQFYHLAVTRTERGRVGMLGHYRVEAQTMDLEWCFSPDGVAWERPLRKAWLPRGEGDAIDCYGIYPPGGLIRRDGVWYLFYTGYNSLHNGKDSCGKPRSAIMLATTKSIWEDGNE